MTLLEIDHVGAGYGDFQALFDVSVSVAVGETAAIIGANGAGKSTLMKAIAGLLPVRSGEIRFDGRSLGSMAAHDRVALGIALVPEGRRIFPSLTVAENLRIGAYRSRSGPWDEDLVLSTFPLLERLMSRWAARLSGGEQQALAIGRGLMSNPRLLLLDEVSLGLAPVVVKQLYGALPRIREAGTTLVVVEQDIGQALAAADHVSCLLEGRVSLAGRPAELQREAITAAYFGLDGAERGDRAGAATAIEVEP
ncbi:MAG: ABC transporter ATP-binding protein [Acidimicrobiia bacterium]